MILDERGQPSFVEWTERAKDLLRPFGNPPQALNEDLWQDWGASLGLLPTFPLFPSPYGFGDWREWVQALNRVVNPPVFTPWATIPNFTTTGAFLVDVLATYYLPTPTSGVLTINGTAPAGWTFVSPNLAHAGAVVTAIVPLSFTLTFPSTLAYTSNTFTVQGI